jgi:hypothetical protein
MKPGKRAIYNYYDKNQVFLAYEKTLESIENKENYGFSVSILRFYRSKK